jgi:hypothetical protein
MPSAVSYRNVSRVSFVPAILVTLVIAAPCTADYVWIEGESLTKPPEGWASLIARIDSGGSNASATAWANVACSTCIGHSRPSGAGKMTG